LLLFSPDKQVGGMFYQQGYKATRAVHSVLEHPKDSEEVLFLLSFIAAEMFHGFLCFQPG